MEKESFMRFLAVFFFLFLLPAVGWAQSSRKNDVQPPKYWLLAELGRKNFVADSSDVSLDRIIKKEGYELELIVQRDTASGKPYAVYRRKDRIDLRSAHKQAFLFMFVLEGLRYADGDMQGSGIQGKFFEKLGSAYHNLDRWPDGDHWTTNFVQHGTIMGPKLISTSFQNDSYFWQGEDNIKILSRAYMNRLGKATLFAGVWSTGFEVFFEPALGPDRYNKNGIVDYVITPLGGAATATLEIITYRHVVSPMIRHPNRGVRTVGKISAALTPGRSFANLMRGKPPWASWRRH